MKKLHIKDCKYNSSSRDFVGIILVALLQGKPMNIEKLMNLIYLVDYKSVNISGSPITMLDFYVHESGPVITDVYSALMHQARRFDIQEHASLHEFINVYTSDDAEVIIEPVKKYYALKFSQYELEVIAKVLEEFGDKSLTELQEITKGEGSLYYDVFKLINLKLNLTYYYAILQPI